MQFTFKSYKNMLSNLEQNGYIITGYDNYRENAKCAILRHDVDYDPQCAFELSKLELMCNVKSTYFVLLSSDFYNCFSKKNIDIFKQIIENGCEIGLHFDEAKYQELDNDIAKEIDYIQDEIEILSKVIGHPVKAVSMHRPSKKTLEANLKIPGVINSYSNEFFKEFKYISDSRRRWREPIDDIINESKYDRLHILTHAFWYSEEELDITEKIRDFVEKGKYTRYDILNEIGRASCRERV